MDCSCAASTQLHRYEAQGADWSPSKHLATQGLVPRNAVAARLSGSCGRSRHSAQEGNLEERNSLPHPCPTLYFRIPERQQKI